MDSARLETLKATFSTRGTYCSGTCHVPPSYFTLFYTHGGDNAASRVDLSKATEAQLESLSRACQPATFGMDNKDVLDETYRKAGKLDLGNFSSPFDPAHAGIVDHINKELLVGDQKLELELYKLNVYEKDGFFKPHQDTPRSEKMFASLVIVFPTEHEGGEFILRHDGDEWVVDFAETLKHVSEPSVGYVAFFSDIEHEVAPVRSGYRVTLTYNLYFASPNSNQSTPKTLPIVSPQERSFEASLTELINCPHILPRGGYLGLGLQYKYPVAPNHELSVLEPFLKGSDAVLANVCERLSLNWSVNVLYKTQDYYGEHYLLMGKIPPYPSSPQEDITSYLRYHQAVLVNFMSSYSTIQKAAAPAETRRGRKKLSTIDLLALRDMNAASKITTQYIAYGNEAELGHIYGHLCLVIQLDPADTRNKL